MSKYMVQEAVKNIHLSKEQKAEMIKELQEFVDENGKDVKRKKKKPVISSPLRAAAVVLVIMIAGAAAALPVKAVVESIIKERFQDVTKEEAIETAEEMDASTAAADSFSRQYTDRETERMAELSRAYMQGTFPNEEIYQVSSRTEAGDAAFYVIVPENYFQLPDHELSDEQLLQIIDYNHKLDYSLQVRYEEEFAREAAAREAENKRRMEEVMAGGGISETEATQIAARYLTDIYGVSPEGMELNCYLDNLEDWFLYLSPPVYIITYSIRSHAYYYFLIDAYDGGLTSTDVSKAEDERKEEITDMELLIDARYETAQDFLQTIIKTDGQYMKVECNYTVIDNIPYSEAWRDKEAEREKEKGNEEAAAALLTEEFEDIRYLAANILRYYFIKKDGTADIVTVHAIDDNIIAYEYVDFEKFIENRTINREFDERYGAAAGVDYRSQVITD